MEEFSVIEKVKQANRSLKRDINLILDKIGINRIFESCAEEDALRKLAAEWVTKELTWQRSKWPGFFHEYLK